MKHLKEVAAGLVVLTSSLVFLSVPAYASLGDLGILGGHKDKHHKSKGESADASGVDPNDPEQQIPPYFGPKKRIAVPDIDMSKIELGSTTTQPTVTGGETTSTTIDIPPPTDFGQGLTEMLMTALFRSGRFSVVERKALQAIQAEQATTNAAGFNQATAAKTGALMGAQVLVQAAITEYSFKKSSIGGTASILNKFGLTHASATAKLSMDIRLIDTATGLLVADVVGTGSASTSAMASNINIGSFSMGGSGYESTPLAGATREAVNRAVRQVCLEMDKLPWEARVLDTDTDDNNKVTQIYVNAGSEMGVKPGDIFEISHPGRTLIDDDTQLVVGRTKDKRIGLCRVDSVTDKMATLIPVDDGDYKKGDIVHFAHAPQTGGSPGTAIAQGTGDSNQTGGAAAGGTPPPASTAPASDSGK